ncbi:hypothetical protein [Hoeflea olei]|uniref:Lipoprotein n=1 Tax=Hoeflea olei TaxID=1480615 RepID=A0A1C1YT05_9HYPH|nr:hypothetical protein [Hoeflea olei]OCW56624.1 hypothetical protein AWJ14_16940 [Hoeflea olei]
MVRSKLLSMPAARALMLFSVVLLLAACAGRPRPVEPTQPFTVTEVRVATQSMADFGFADHLQERLSATAGRATSDIGLNAILRIVVLDRAAEPAEAGMFAARTRSATLDVVLVDAETGQMLRSRLVHAAIAARGGAAADAELVEALVREIRALLGLSGTQPYPVSGSKRRVALPSTRPAASEDASLSDAAMSADPLLNGTVTPTTVDFDTAPERSLPDLSRPLLTPPSDATPQSDATGADATGAAEGQAAEVADAPVPEAKPARPLPETGPQAPQSAQMPARPETAPATEGAATGDEPCVITLDNDCADPDAR